MYCGMTKWKFSVRMSEHRDYAKFHKTEEPSGSHFNNPGHSFHNIQGLAIEQVRSKDPFILKARENWLIKKFDCYRNGLNKENWKFISLASVGSFLSLTFWTRWIKFVSGCLKSVYIKHFYHLMCCEHDPRWVEIYKH